MQVHVVEPGALTFFVSHLREAKVRLVVGLHLFSLLFACLQLLLPLLLECLLHQLGAKKQGVNVVDLLLGGEDCAFPELSGSVELAILRNQVEVLHTLSLFFLVQLLAI